MGNLEIVAPNTSLSCDAQDRLVWGKVQARLSGHPIALQSLHADTINLRTTNSPISGAFDASHISLGTTNGSISAKLIVQEPHDEHQSTVVVETANSFINLHVDATLTMSGVWMETKTRNGKINVGALLGPSNLGSYVSAITDNGTIDFSLDASQTGQPLDVYNKTVNAAIVSSIMVPHEQPFSGNVQTTNSPVTLNLVSAWVVDYKESSLS